MPTIPAARNPPPPAGIAALPIRHRIDAVDGLRGLAILAVLLFHIKTFMIPAGGELAIFDFGWAGVDLFFVLSGFLITGILWDSRERGDYFRVFYARRTLRIFPLYFLVLFAIYVVGPAALRALHRPDVIHGLIYPKTQAYAWFYLLNIAQAFSVPVTVLLVHFWSLSIEEQFYLVWPLIVRKFTRRRLMLVCAAMIVVSLPLRIGFYAHGMEWAAYVLTICRMDSLAIGAVIALALRSREEWLFLAKSAPAVIAVAAFTVALLVWRAPGFDGVWMRTVGISAFGLLFGGSLTLAIHFAPGALEWRVLRFFGKYSYSLYAVHQPMIYLLLRGGISFIALARYVHQPWLEATLINALIIGISVVAALASWHLFEKHFLRLKRAFPV